MADTVLQRRVLLGIALLATVAASFWPGSEENTPGQIVEPVARAVRTASATERTMPADAQLPPLGEKLERLPATQTIEDLFAPTSWVPPAAKAAAAVPSAPTAPPFPYSVVGGLTDNKLLTVVFSGQSQNFVLRVGESFADTYRLDEVNASSITVTYLPLGQKQVLPLGTSN